MYIICKCDSFCMWISVYVYNTKSMCSFTVGETNHWIRTCYSSKERSTVMVMDSLGLFTGLNDSTLLQVSKIYNSTAPKHESSLKIRKLSIQQQKGSLDCGVFSSAYAVEVCMGRNVLFDQEKMRQHLHICFSNGVLKIFLEFQVVLKICRDLLYHWPQLSFTASVECLRRMMTWFAVMFAIDGIICGAWIWEVTPFPISGCVTPVIYN